MEGGLLVVFLTKEALCGAPERRTISASLCFILEWLRRKIINTMKSKFLSVGELKETPFFSESSLLGESWDHSPPLLWLSAPSSTCFRWGNNRRDASGVPTCASKDDGWWWVATAHMFLDGWADDRCTSKPTLISWAVEWSHNNRPLTKKTSTKRAKWKKWKTVCMQMEKLTIQ